MSSTLKSIYKFGNLILWSLTSMKTDWKASRRGKMTCRKIMSNEVNRMQDTTSSHSIIHVFIMLSVVLRLSFVLRSVSVTHSTWNGPWFRRTFIKEILFLKDQANNAPTMHWPLKFPPLTWYSQLKLPPSTWHFPLKSLQLPDTPHWSSLDLLDTPYWNSLHLPDTSNGRSLKLPYTPHWSSL